MNFFAKIFGFGKKNKCQSQCCDKCQLSDADKAVLKNIDPRIVIGQIQAVAAHPDPKMTKVRVTKTQVSADMVEQILCGGTNVDEDIIVAVATVGAKLSEDFEIGEREIRGEMSRGMICARAELGLNPNGEQKGEIWILPPAFKSKIGTPLKDIA